MKICIEIPSNNQQDIDRIIELAKDCAYGFYFAIASNGDADKSEYTSKNVIVRYHDIAGEVSMMELRKEAAMHANFFSPDFRVISDGNCVFKEGWEKFIRGCQEDASELLVLTGKDSFIMVMAGSFGSNSSKGKTHVPMSPMFATIRGILYPNNLRHAWDEVEILPGGFEDHYFSSYCIKKLGAVPLKKFNSPIDHKATYRTSGSVIHDRDMWKNNNLARVQEIWEDPNWNSPIDYNNPGKPSGGGYHAKQPKTSLEYMCELRDEISQIKGGQRYFKRIAADEKYRKSMKSN